MSISPKYVVLWILLILGSAVRASHVLGGEITYQHIKENQYKVLLKIYRDCNGCKINGSGGGNSQENCAGIEYLFVKGYDNTTSKETRISLTREGISDITPVCKTGQSVCRTSPTMIYGIEQHLFSATVDFDQTALRGFCNYTVYVILAERNNNIISGQAGQNFCVDAGINICQGAGNSSPVFQFNPAFILNVNKKNQLNFYTRDTQGDSLAYQLVPALISVDKDANYNKGYTFSEPLSVYCPESPCKTDRKAELPTGFSFDRLTGDCIFMPVNASERAVVAVKITEYRKISGKWEPIGHIRRDIQVYVKTSDGNATPFLFSKTDHTVCEGNTLEIKLEARDEKNSITNEEDSVRFSMHSETSGISLSEYSQGQAPFRYALLRWEPPKGSSRPGAYQVQVSVHDNFCPLNAASVVYLNIHVLPKEKLGLDIRDLGCGNYEFTGKFSGSKSKYKLTLSELTGNRTLFTTSRFSDTVPSLLPGKYLVSASLEALNGCETIITDTLAVGERSTHPEISGDTLVCMGTPADYMLLHPAYPGSTISWYINDAYAGSGNSLNSVFTRRSVIRAVSSLKHGKWVCADTLIRDVKILNLPVIEGPLEFRACHNSGEVILKSLPVIPAGGVWISGAPQFRDSLIDTRSEQYYYEDTLKLEYEVTDQNGCRADTSVRFILDATPEFELNSAAVCQLNTPVRFEHLVRKPYNVRDYTYTWSLDSSSAPIHDENGFKVVYPLELGIGRHPLTGMVTGKNGCSNKAHASFDISKGVKIEKQEMPVFCQGQGMINLTKAAGITPEGGTWSFYDFELFRDRKNLLTDTCGTFEATYVYDDFGCYDDQKFTISILCKPAMEILGPADKICTNSLPVELKATPGGGTWTGPFLAGGQFNPPVPVITSQYTLTYTIQSGSCSFVTGKTVNVIPSPEVKLTSDKSAWCEGEWLTVSGTLKNTDSLIFRDNNGTHGIQTPGRQSLNSEKISTLRFIPTDKGVSRQTLQVLGKNKSGCISEEKLYVDVYQVPSISGLHDTLLCSGDRFEFVPKIIYNGLPALNYTWQENKQILSTGSALNSSTLSTGDHLLTFTAGSGQCEDEATILVTIAPLPFVDFRVEPFTTVSASEPEFVFSSLSDQGIYHQWDPGNGFDDNLRGRRDITYRYSDTGHYTVRLRGTNQYGCVNEVSKQIEVRPDILLFIPNAFTPDNKGEEKNNVFRVSLLYYSSYLIEIFDRWGQKVYRSTDPGEAWDGRSGPSECTPDVYFYTISVTSETGKNYKYKGTLNLIR